MADFNSSLPVRTENPGDVIAKIADATTPSQQLAIDSSGRVTIKLDDGAGNIVTSQANGAQRALDVGINVLGVQIDPRDIRALTASDIVTANQGTAASIAGAWPVGITDGTNSLSLTAAGEAKVDLTSSASFGSASGGTAASVSELIGGLYNSSLPTLTSGQQAAFQLDSSGRLIISPLSGSSVTVTNLPTTVDVNYGTVGASTLRSASQIGNATGAADFNAGATGAQTLRVIANQGAANATPWNENIAQIAGAVPSATNALPTQIATAGAFVSASNPLPVIIDPSSAGTPVNDYKDASAIASGASDNHDYTVTAAKTLYLQSVYGSASGKAKMIVSVETGVASGTFTVVGAFFNSTATPNMRMDIPAPIHVAAGVRVRIVMSNRDLLAEDLYSSICGFEV